MSDVRLQTDMKLRVCASDRLWHISLSELRLTRTGETNTWLIGVDTGAQIQSGSFFPTISFSACPCMFPVFTWQNALWLIWVSHWDREQTSVTKLILTSTKKSLYQGDSEAQNNNFSVICVILRGDCYVIQFWIWFHFQESSQHAATSRHSKFTSLFCLISFLKKKDLHTDLNAFRSKAVHYLRDELWIILIQLHS